MNVDGISTVLRLPVKFLGSSDASTAKLTLSEGGEDEPEEGPTSFAVFADHSLAIADPLARRIVVYSADGRLLRTEETGFATDDIRGDGSIIVRDATSEQWFSRGPSGVFDVSAGAPEVLTRPARLLGGDRAFLPGNGANGEKGSVSISWSGSQLVAVEHVGQDADGSVYIAIESRSTVTDPIQKSVRKYAAGGRLIAEVRNIPTDYYVTPRTEFRVRDGMLYQMQPERNEIRINIWDLAPIPVGGK